MTTATPSTAVRSTFWPALTSLLFIQLFSGIVQMYFIPLYPSLAHRYHLQVGTLSLALIMFTVSGASSTLLFARLGDLYGHRRILRLVVGLVALGSVLIAVAPTFPVLLVGRVLQGTYPALLPLTFGVVQTRFADADVRRRGYAYVNAVLSFGASVGLLATGMLARPGHGPSWALWFPAVGTVVGFGLLWSGRRAEPTPVHAGRVDWPGAVLFGIGLASLLLGVNQGGTWGWQSAATIGAITGGVTVIAGWIVAELRMREPLVDLRVLFRPQLLPPYAIGVGFYFGGIGGQVALSTYLSLSPHKVGYGLGLNASIAGLVIGGGILGTTILAACTARFGRIVGFRWMMACGALMVTAGYTGMIVVHRDAAAFIACHVLSSAGAGLIIASTRTVVAELATPSEAGVAQGMYELASVVGGAVGSAAISALLTSARSAGVVSERGYEMTWSVSAAVGLAITIIAILHALRHKRNALATPTRLVTGHP
ncbi:MFS transporter [Nocardia miyunensis]|uniref:MFS transporter n=1 Tax=Nocardia miyunensis TaxID=282684 RepID=UPI000A06D3E6|nr:MFS transporter [Nocardia miyunensis]